MKYATMGLVFGDTFSEARAATLETIVDLARDREFDLGGMPTTGAKSATYVDVPGASIIRLAANLTVLLRAMAYVSAGTGYFRLYSVTAGVEVAGSEKSFTNTAAALVENATELELAAGDYKLQVKTSDAANHVVVWGARAQTL